MEQEGAEAQPSGLAQPGLLSSLLAGLSPAGKWLSIFRRPHEPGDLSQASENFQGRIGSSHAVPVVSRSHRRCAVKFVFFFQFISYSEPPGINPFRGKRIGLRWGSLHNLALNSSLFG